MIVINTGATANDGTGDKLRDAFIIVNQNFLDIQDILDVVLTDSSIIPISQISGLQTILDDLSYQVSLIPGLQDDINSINSTIFTINQTLNSQNSSINELYSLVNDLQQQIFTKIGEAPIDGQQYVRQDAEWVVSTGGGGTGSYLPLAGGTMDADADIFFANGSKLSEGIVDAGTGGNKGIALTCAVGYEWKFEAGEAYLTNLSGNFIEIKQYAKSIPFPTDDITKGFVSGSKWYTDNFTYFYECTDTTPGAAVWEQRFNELNLQQITDTGYSTTNNLIVVDAGGRPFSEMSSGRFITQDDNTGSFTSIQSNGELAINTTGQIGYLKTTNVETSYTLEFPDKVPGSYTIATTEDISGLVPYTGATGDVNIFPYNLTAGNLIGDNLQLNGAFGAGFAQFYKQDAPPTSAGIEAFRFYANNQSYPTFKDQNNKVFSFNTNSIGSVVELTIPNADGTIALTNNVINSISAVGPITRTTGVTPIISTSMSSNRLIGRYATGSGVMQEVTIGSGLTLTGAGVLNNTATGATGATGPAGTNGISVSYYRYNARTNSQTPPPATKQIMWNNATQINSTILYISHLTIDNIDIDVFLALIKTGDTLIVQDQNNSNNYQKWTVSGTPTIISNDYVSVPVTYVTGGYSFSNGHDIILVPLSIGIQGPQGATGSIGPQGPTGPTGPLDSLSNVSITGTPSNNSLLTYGTSSVWENRTLEQIGGVVNVITDGLPGTPVTGGTTLTRSLIKSFRIPANTFTTGDMFEVWAIGSKVNTNTSFYISININTSNTLSGATELGRVFSNNVNITYMPFQRIYNFTTSTNLRGAVTNSGSTGETNLTGTSISNTTFNTAIDNWFLFSVTPVTGGTADIMNIEKVIVTKTKYKLTV